MKEVHSGKKISPIKFDFFSFRRDTTDKYVKYLVKIANKNDEVKMWLFKHKDVLNEVLGETGKGNCSFLILFVGYRII